MVDPRLLGSADVHQGTRVVAARDAGAEDRLVDVFAHVAVPLAHPLFLDGQGNLEGGEHFALADPLGDDFVDATLCGDTERHDFPLRMEWMGFPSTAVRIDMIPLEMPSVAG